MTACILIASDIPRNIFLLLFYRIHIRGDLKRKKPGRGMPSCDHLKIRLLLDLKSHQNSIRKRLKFAYDHRPRRIHNRNDRLLSHRLFCL